MEPSTKFMNITGEIVRRINNPEQTSRNGKKYRINYLVLKWVSGRAGKEYIDYVPIKVLEYKSIADLRAGYIVTVPVIYSCSIRDKVVNYKTINSQGTMVERPNLYPEFTLLKGRVIEIVNSNVNYEEYDELNKQFEKQLFNSDNYNNNEPVDDLPF